MLGDFLFDRCANRYSYKRSFHLRCMALLHTQLLGYQIERSIKRTLSKSIELMYQSNRSFNIPPPGQPPWHLNFWKIFVQIPPSPGQKGDQMPPPPRKLHHNSAQRISSFTGTWMKESRLRRLQLLNKI